MKRLTLFLIVTLLTLGVYAQNADNKWAIGLGPGVYWNLDKSEDNVGVLGELYLSRYLSPSFDLMLKGNGGWVNEYFRRENGDVFHQDFGAAFLNLRYKLANGKLFSETAKIQPYLFAGPGLIKDNRLSGLNFNAGLGSKFPVSDNVALYLEAGYINDRLSDDEEAMQYGLKTDNTDNFFKVNGVVEFALGKPKDSDGDGVPDRKDKCPGTPAGVAVDADGCPLDRDGDGVPDYKDECPDVPGLAALNGCPDKDGDGIPDHKDECPDVPGLKKFNGCPDTDEDGVPDPKDECPNTPKGCAVDAKGCPLDTDKDGVIDCEDQCPTQPGPKENKGCPVTCVDFDVNPVYFDFDKSLLRPEGKQALDAFVSKLGDCKNFEIVVNGHTCNIGSNNYNQGLSERRAQEVVKYLITKGVGNAYIGSKGYGETQPAVPNTNKTNREKNRRAEIDLTVK